jgi:phasin family protein
MKNDIIGTLTAQSQAVVEPIQKLNKLVVANTEKVAALQLATLQSYADLGISHLKAAADVQDAKGAQGFIAKNGELAKLVGEKVAADAKAFGQLGTQFNAEVQKLVQESLKVVTVKAA